MSELHPFLDDNQLIRLGGILQRLQDNVDVKHRMILPNGHYFTELVTKEAHCPFMHGGITHTKSQLRHIFWVTRARQQVKKIIGRCLLCPRLGVTAPSVPYSPLSPERISESTPFKVTGVDFAGHMYAKEAGTSGRKKIYLVTHMSNNKSRAFGVGHILLHSYASSGFSSFHIGKMNTGNDIFILRTYFQESGKNFARKLGNTK